MVMRIFSFGSLDPTSAFRRLESDLGFVFRWMSRDSLVFGSVPADSLGSTVL
jgi:hypothetical protein